MLTRLMTAATPVARATWRVPMNAAIDWSQRVRVCGARNEKSMCGKEEALNKEWLLQATSPRFILNFFDCPFRFILLLPLVVWVTRDGKRAALDGLSCALSGPQNALSPR